MCIRDRTYINRENFEAMQGFHAGWRKSGIGGADGKHGLEEYLQTQVVNLSSRNSTLNVRAEPHTDAAIVGTLAHGWRLIVVKTLDGWAQIRTADLSGYVSLDYIQFE